MYGGWDRILFAWFLVPDLWPLLRGPGGDLLSRVLRRSTIGAEGFHGRVRDGIGWGTLAMATRSSQQRTDVRFQMSGQPVLLAQSGIWHLILTFVFCSLSSGVCVGVWGSARSSSAIERLGPVSCTYCYASTSGLSTCWSGTALMRDLVLRGVSRLDAFSGYLVRT